MAVTLVLLEKNGSKKRLPLPGGVSIIGRAYECDIRIPHMSVSKRHCKIANYDGNLLILSDLRSKNGTVVNRKPIHEATLKSGDVIRIGPTKVLVHIASKSTTRQPVNELRLRRIAAQKKRNAVEPRPQKRELAPLDSSLGGFIAPDNQ